MLHFRLIYHKNRSLQSFLKETVQMSLPGIIIGFLATQCLLYLLFWDYLSLQLYQSFHYFGSTLFYTHRHRHLVCLCHIVGQTLVYSPTTYIYDSNYFEIGRAHSPFKRTCQYKCATAGCKMAFSLPPCLSTMCDGLIRN